MAVKSIIEIELQDGAFKTFKTLFDKHKAAIDALPDGWAKIGRATKTASEGLKESADLAEDLRKRLYAARKEGDDIGEAFVLAAINAHALVEAQGKVKNETTAVVRAVSASNVGMTSLERSSKGVAANISSATTQLLRWTGALGAVGGLLGAGGIWGIDRMAAGAAAARKGAAGLGISIGEQEAFGIDYQPVLSDPNSFLKNIAEARSDVTKQAVWSQLGITDWRDKDAAQLAPEVLERIRSRFKQTNGSSNVADALGLTTLLPGGFEDVRRLGATSQDDLDKRGAKFAKDASALNIPDSTANAWTDFTTQMQLAGQTIENTFITGLVPLAKPLEDLSESATSLVAAFLKSDAVEEGITGLSDELKRLAKWLKGDDFKKDVDDFEGKVKRLGYAIGGAYEWIVGHFPSLGPDKSFGKFGPQLALPAPDAGLVERAAQHFLSVADEQRREALEAGAWQSKATTLNLSDAELTEGSSARKNGVPEAFARAIFHAENGLNPDGSARVSSAGAIGAGQLMPGTARDLGVNPYDTSANIWGSTRYMSDLLKRFGGDQDKAAAAYNWGAGHLQADLDKNGDKWRDSLPNETAKYIASIHAFMTQDKLKLDPNNGYETPGPLEADAQRTKLRKLDPNNGYETPVLGASDDDRRFAKLISELRTAPRSTGVNIRLQQPAGSNLTASANAAIIR